MSMRLDLELLSIRLSQKEAELTVSTDGVNTYLLENVLQPCMEGNPVFLGDIAFDAFAPDDIQKLGAYHDNLIYASEKLVQFVKTVDCAPPAASRNRMFC